MYKGEDLMSRILIAYATKTGTAQKCAGMLADLLGGVQLADLSAEQPDPADYDLVIVGGGVRMGLLHKVAREYLKRWESALAGQVAAYFVCNAFVNQTEEVLRQNIPPVLLEKAVCADTFGGELEPEKLKGIDRLIVRMVTSSGGAKEAVRIRRERIDAFAAAVRKALPK